MERMAAGLGRSRLLRWGGRALAQARGASAGGARPGQRSPGPAAGAGGGPAPARWLAAGRGGGPAPARWLAAGRGGPPAPARWLAAGGARPPHSLPTRAADVGAMSPEDFNPARPSTDWKVAKKHLEKSDRPERRRYYKAERYVTLDEIQTWKDLAEGERFKQPPSHYTRDDIMNQTLSLLQEDITKLEVDAVVNAVDGAIHAAAGPLLQKECSTLGGCNTGDAKMTSGYCLPAKHVIHTVGPVVRGKERLPENDLRSCYLKSLKLAEDNRLRTIAFPCISTGVYGYPNGQAAETVLKAVREYLKEHRNSFDRIIFCVFLKFDHSLYKEKMPFYFPYDAVTPQPPKEKPNSADKDKTQAEKTLKLENKQGAGSQGQL
ncbi:ADP-ribose glycohydrolase MACROD1-like isoform X2 [Scyliorhinus torazame]|uniref:ADP-ribose glycohydrolase MACROD1-like isoform X2 n=1 Tax=Scyliorhinus torazame TaxID=75743 RepID=UPI003B5C28F8